MSAVITVEYEEQTWGIQYVQISLSATSVHSTLHETLRWCRSKVTLHERKYRHRQIDWDRSTDLQRRTDRWTDRYTWTATQTESTHRETNGQTGRWRDQESMGTTAEATWKAKYGLISCNANSLEVVTARDSLTCPQGGSLAKMKRWTISTEFLIKLTGLARKTTPKRSMSYLHSRKKTKGKSKARLTQTTTLNTTRWVKEIAGVNNRSTEILSRFQPRET